MTQHILLYTDEPGVGGVAQYNHAIVTGLRQRGYRVTVAQGEASHPLIAEQIAIGIQHEWLAFDTLKEFGRTLTCVEDSAAILCRSQPDLIIFSDGCPLSSFAAKQSALQFGIPFIIVVGFVDPALATTFACYLPELAQHYAQAQAVIAVSQENLALLRQLFGLPAGQGEVIYYGRPERFFAPPDLALRDRLRQSVGIPLDAVVCFTAARLEGIKGYQYQLDAIRRLQSTSVWAQLYFVWAGDGALRDDIAAAISEIGVADRVKLLGQRWDVADWYDAADIFVLPTYLEGMPLAIMEAMAKGLPVVATAVSGIPEEMGDTGQLLPDPKQDPQATLSALVQTLQVWGIDRDCRQAIGQAGQIRAAQLFREDRMVQQTRALIDRALLPSGDYVAPGLAIVYPDAAFPHLQIGDANTCPWPYLRREIPHNWYVDQRQPIVGFLSRDEAQILYNLALQFSGQRALEIGCWVGWSACHLALAGVELDVIDPLLTADGTYPTVHEALQAAGVRDRVNLVAGCSPQAVTELAAQHQRQWSLIFIDGNHDAPGPLADAIATGPLAAPDAMIVFHDLACPDVAAGLDYFQQQGWQTLVYQTMQIMGIAWRGNVQPIAHQPDPNVNWELPDHLQHYSVSGISPPVLIDPIAHLLTLIASLSLPPVQLVKLDLTHRQQLVNWLIQGQVAYIKGQWQPAIAAFQQVLLINPASVMAHQYLSWLYWQQNEWVLSIKHHALAPVIDLTQCAQDQEFQTLLAIVRPYTLLSTARLFNSYTLAKQICLDDIPGNFVECGTCRGGSAALLAVIIQRYSLRPRQLYAFDTFAGMPEPTDYDRTSDGTPAHLTSFGAGTLKAPLPEYLNVICETLGVTEIVHPVTGLFADTLPSYQAEIGPIALLHADGDWYESTMDIFKTLYAAVVTDGAMQIDDYGHWAGCRQAIAEFARSGQTTFALRAIDDTGVWFRKTPAIDFSPWQTLWALAKLSFQGGHQAQSATYARAVLKLRPGLLQAEELLMALGENPAEFDRRCPEIPQFLTTDRQAELLQDLKLRTINLVVFPDWQQPEEPLFYTLVNLLRNVITNPNHSKITLLIDTSSANVSDVDETISHVLMHLLIELAITVEVEPELTLINQFNVGQWQLILPHLTAQIKLEVENQTAIAPLTAAIAQSGRSLPSWPLGSQFLTAL